MDGQLELSQDCQGRSVYFSTIPEMMPKEEENASPLPAHSKISFIIEVLLPMLRTHRGMTIRCEIGSITTDPRMIT